MPRKRPKPYLPQHASAESGHHLPARKHRFLYWLVPTSLLLIALLGCAAWVGFRGVQAKQNLEAAQTLIVDLQAKATAKDFAGAAKDAALIKSHTVKARDDTSDFLWRAAEVVPGVGVNFTVVRQLADVVNGVANGAIDPAVKLMANFSLNSLKPVNGHINLAPIKQASAVVVVADNNLRHAEKRVKSIDATGTVSMVKNAVAKLDRLLTKAAGTTGELRKVLPLLSPMLGGEGERNYIILFQNNAESMSLGGAASAWVVLNVNNGAISITAQPSTGDFPRQPPLVIPMKMDPEVVRLFSLPGLGFSNNVTVIPDFPTVGKLAQAFWQRKSGQKVDGVMAFDPIALGYLLDATGPLTLKSGDVLNSQDAVPLLLSEVYSKYPNPTDQDAFFASAASSIFKTLTSAKPDLNKLIAALTRGMQEHRLMIWSDHPQEQAQIAQSPLSGIQPMTNKKATEVGVFFVEHSASKMSYYLKTAVALSSTQCQAPNSPVFAANVTLHSDISPAAEKKLPAYVRSQFYKKPVKTDTLVYVYGPVGAKFTDFNYAGGGLDGQLVTTSNQAGRPVALVSIDLMASQSASFVVHFTGNGGKYGPLTSRVTPMIQPTVVTLNAPACAAK